MSYSAWAYASESATEFLVSRWRPAGGFARCGFAHCHGATGLVTYHGQRVLAPLPVGHPAWGHLTWGHVLPRPCGLGRRCCSRAPVVEIPISTAGQLARAVADSCATGGGHSLARSRTRHQGRLRELCRGLARVGSVHRRHRERCSPHDLTCALESPHGKTRARRRWTTGPKVTPSLA